MKATRERARGAPRPAPDWPPALPGGTLPPGADLVELDPLIHERTRLAILTALSTADGGARLFLDLRAALHLTDGNLLAHLRALEQGGLVSLVKTGAGRGSSTTVLLSGTGRRAFQTYLGQLEALIQAARRTGRPAAGL